MNTAIDILLTTCNGALYLPEQLDSLLAQTCCGWRLLVRDDGSSDATPEILENYRSRYPDVFVIIPSEGQHLGACGNFGRLLDRTDAAYIMFCDQDDVWLPGKIETTLAAMLELERQHGAETPLLVHTDLMVVDERLNRLGDSLWLFQCTAPQRLMKLNRVLMQNFATGCTVMINRTLRDLAVPVPSEALMYDWWLALTTTAFGRVAAVERPTVLYRQHGRNDTGATRWNFLSSARIFVDCEQRRKAIALLDAALASQADQATVFVDRYRERLSLAERRTLNTFCSLRRRNFIARRYLMLRYGFFYSNATRNLGLLLSQ